MCTMRQKNQNSHGVRFFASLLKNHVMLVLLSLLISACGGGEARLADNGVGGTGITQGRITHLDTGAASAITVNDIRFDTENALLIRDGDQNANKSDFHIGEIVTVKGKIKPDGKQGIATEVIFDDTLEGPVTSPASGNSIEILGQTVLIDDRTLFYGFDQLSDLKEGYVVEVSGFINKQQQILASTLTLQKTTLTIGEILKVEGRLESLDPAAKTFKINNLTVDYSAVSVDEQRLKDSVYVLVRTQQAVVNKLMVASDIDIINSKLSINTSYKKDGYITKIIKENSFDMEGITVITQLNTEYINGSKQNLVKDKHVIVSGKTNSQGELLADQIYLVDRQTQIVLEGFLEKLDKVNKKITVFGTDILIDDVTRSIKDASADGINELVISFDKLKVGDYIYVEAYSRNRQYRAFEVVKTPANTDSRVLSVVQSSDEARGTISLFSHQVMVDQNTQYSDIAGKPVDRKAFFQLLKNNQTLLDTYGLQIDPKTLAAKAIFIDTSW